MVFTKEVWIANKTYQQGDEFDFLKYNKRVLLLKINRVNFCSKIGTKHISVINYQFEVSSECIVLKSLQNILVLYKNNLNTGFSYRTIKH